MSDDKKTTSPTLGDGGTTVDCTKVPCPCTDGKLVSLTVIRNATQTNVTGAKNWAAVKKASDEVVVEATTSPNSEACWQAIKWSGDSGSPGDKPNQRKLSRATSKKFHVEAELGGVKDSVDVWVLWAIVTINTSSTTPANAVQYGARYDGTENLGAKEYDGGSKAVGKVVPDAKITPAGVRDVVKAGWAFRREMKGKSWDDGIPDTADHRFFKPDWVDDTSDASFQNLTPDADDKIYDRDAPNIAGFGTTDSEIYYTFRQWIEWSGDISSDRAEWHWQARWKSTAPHIRMKDVGTGSLALPNSSFFHPP